MEKYPLPILHHKTKRIELKAERKEKQEMKKDGRHSVQIEFEILEFLLMYIYLHLNKKKLYIYYLYLV